MCFFLMFAMQFDKLRHTHKHDVVAVSFER